VSKSLEAATLWAMKKLRRYLFRAFALIALLGTAVFVQLWYFKPVFIGAFFERVFIQYALDDPEMLSSLGILRPLGLTYYEDDLTDASPNHERAVSDKLIGDLATLRRYDRNSLKPDQQLSFDVLEYFLDVQARGVAFQHHDYPVNQLFGAQNGYPRFMNEVHDVKSVSDAQNYIARLHKVERKFAGVLDGLKLREAEGILPPRFVLEKVLIEMRAFSGVPAAQNSLYTEFQTKLKAIPAADMTQAQRTDFSSQVETAINTSVYRAYGTLIAYYQELLPKVTRNDGVWALPNGDAFYDWAIEQNTTTKMSADTLHALGLSEVATIEAQMDGILRSEGLIEGTIGARVEMLSSRPDQLRPNTDAGRAEILADYKTILTEVQAKLGPYFDTQPQAKIEVRRVPAFAEKTAPGAYYDGPSLDGGRPGVFYANLRDTAETPRFGMRTLAYHEGIPGHHFQISLAGELKGVPTFRRILPFTAFAEGWALYSERLAWEIGLEQAPLDNLGRLQAEMMRAVRLVVDTGLHRKRWTREQAINYMRDKTGMADGEVTSEIERYLVNPGQALAYKVGMLKILELREKAKHELGSKFDIRQFHNEVLMHGSLPLTMLEQVIDRYIARVKTTA
jgi:uncharacterized protein (DUF885 family)